MAANTDKFKYLARKWVGQIGAGGVADDTTTTIPLSSTTNLPTDTAVTVVIDRVDSNGTKTPTAEETVTGVVSGSNLVTCTRGVEGTAQAHSAGAVVEVLLTASDWQDVMDGILVQHDQSGRHTNPTACNITASGTLTATTATIGAATASATITSCNVVTSAIVSNSLVARTTNANLGLSGNGTGDVEIATGLKIDTEAYFDAEIDDGNSGTADTIDWTTGNKHKSTVTGGVTYTFTSPSGPANLILKLVNGGSQTITWPGTVVWSGGTEPSWTASGTDIVAFYWDGSSYYGQGSLNFS